jgi:hypothetical protein
VKGRWIGGQRGVDMGVGSSPPSPQCIPRFPGTYPRPRVPKGVSGGRGRSWGPNSPVGPQARGFPGTSNFRAVGDPHRGFYSRRIPTGHRPPPMYSGTIAFDREDCPLSHRLLTCVHSRQTLHRIFTRMQQSIANPSMSEMIGLPE